MNNRGFSIIELAIVILISGVIVAALASAYNIYLNKYNFDQTNLRITEAEDALEEFFETNGRLPCAAPRNVANTEKSYGREVNCSAGASGTVRVNGKGGKKVRIGLFPARTLGVSDIYMQDAYGNTLLYAVTEEATDEDTYATDGGAIDVVDGTNASLLTDVDYAQYVIISAGPNHNGAYSNAGVQIDACDTNKLESENCDDDAIFMDTLRAHADDANYYEDTIRYDYKLAPTSGKYCPPATILYETTWGSHKATCSIPLMGNGDGNISGLETSGLGATLISESNPDNYQYVEPCGSSVWASPLYCENGKWVIESMGNKFKDVYDWRNGCDKIIVEKCTTNSSSFSCTGRGSNKVCNIAHKGLPTNYAISVKIIQ